MMDDVKFLNDYLEWANGVESLGVDVSPETFIHYRAGLDLESRVEKTAAFLYDLAWGADSPERSEVQQAWEMLTGVDYPDPVQPPVADQLAIKRAAKAEHPSFRDPDDAA